MVLDIPKDERELMRRWFTTTDLPIDEIIAALEAAKPALKSATLVAEVAAATKTKVEPDTLVDVLFAFMNLARTAGRMDEEERREFPALLFRLVVEELVEADKKVLFQKRVERVLKAPALVITAKALHVLQDNPRTFCRARTLSELRPIFSDDTLEPLATVVVHQLKVVFHAGPKGERDELFFSMDREDLNKLQVVVNRALQKDDKLRALAESAGLPLL